MEGVGWEGCGHQCHPGGHDWGKHRVPRCLLEPGRAWLSGSGGTCVAQHGLQETRLLTRATQGAARGGPGSAGVATAASPAPAPRYVLKPLPGRRHTPCRRARAGRGGRGVQHVRERPVRRGGSRDWTGWVWDRRRRVPRGADGCALPGPGPRVAGARRGSRGQVDAPLRPLPVHHPPADPRTLPTLRVAAAGQHADGLAGPGHPQLLQVHGGHCGAESSLSLSASAAARAVVEPALAPPRPRRPRPPVRSPLPTRVGRLQVGCCGRGGPAPSAPKVPKAVPKGLGPQAHVGRLNRS